jgi:hypothetical protein
MVCAYEFRFFLVFIKVMVHVRDFPLFQLPVSRSFPRLTCGHQYRKYWRSFQLVLLCGALFVVSGASASVARADVLPDSIRAASADTIGHDQSPPATGMTAAGYVAAMDNIAWSDVGTIGMHPVINGHLIMRHDSVVVLVDSLVRVWLHALQHDGPLAPRQLINQAALQVQIGRDADAQRSIGTWLATPGASANDSLVAFLRATELFSRTFKNEPPTTERMQLARSYLARLEAMPFPASATLLFQARMVVMAAYIKLGAADSAVATGLRAYAMLPRIPSYEIRAGLAASEAILDLARVLAGRPNGLVQIDSLLARLKREFIVPPALLAQDTALGRFSQGAQDAFAESEAKLRWFGHAAPPIVATHWFNRPPPPTPSAEAPGARALTLNDGIIRIIGFGWFGCPACMTAMANLQQDQKLLPRGVELLYYEWTLGSWGNALCEPAEEVEHLRYYLLDRKHYTFPIAIWAGPKDSTPDGGLLPRQSSVRVAMHIDAGPTFIVIDGHGIVRHWQQGYYMYTNDFESLITRLVQERDHEVTASATTGIHDRP